MANDDVGMLVPIASPVAEDEKGILIVLLRIDNNLPCRPTKQDFQTVEDVSTEDALASKKVRL